MLLLQCAALHHHPLLLLFQASTAVQCLRSPFTGVLHQSSESPNQQLLETSRTVSNYSKVVVCINLHISIFIKKRKHGLTIISQIPR